MKVPEMCKPFLNFFFLLATKGNFAGNITIWNYRGLQCLSKSRNLPYIFM